MSENDDAAVALAANQKAKRTYNRIVDSDKNPCIRESMMSMECMSKNGYDRDKCYDYFKNYRSCMNFWKKVAKDRRRKGIKPVIPTAEERAVIWEEFKKNRGK